MINTPEGLKAWKSLLPQGQHTPEEYWMISQRMGKELQIYFDEKIGRTDKYSDDLSDSAYLICMIIICALLFIADLFLIGALIK